MSDLKLGAIFYPAETPQGKEIPFDSLFIPHIYREIYFENVYLDILNQKKDLTILDIGANIGITVQYFKDYAKKVLAVEPSTEHFNALEKNKEFNKWDNVVLEKAAVSDKDGETQLSYNMGNRTCNSITNNYGGDGEVVKTIAFDTLLEKHNIDKVDFCKFDVEGADDLVLRSDAFKKVCHKVKAIEVEFHHQTWPDLVSYMQSLGYEARRYESSAVIVLFTRND